jgi:DNA topoisomerase-1
MRPATDAERKALGIPPAYTEPLVAIDPQADLIAMATITTPSGKTKPFYKYSKSFIERRAKEKYKRVAKLASRIDKIEKRIASDSEGTSEDRHLAMTARLILLTGMRIGNPPQGVGESFGATSLLLSHCTPNGSSVKLDFIGKKGVAQSYVVKDSVLTEYVKERKGEARLFPHEANAVLRYMKKIGLAKAHDIRTLHAMTIAEALIKEVTKDGPPTTKKAVKLIRKTVGAEVGKILGNNASQAIKSYIDAKLWPEMEEKG